jgi:hypothetical protein
MLLFSLMMSILLSMPFVQTKIAHYATTRIQEDYGAEISIKKVDLSFLGSVTLKEVEIRDHHKDTLIFVEKLNTSLLNIRGIAKNRIALGSVSLKGAYYYLKTYKGEEQSGFAMFLESFEKESPKDTVQPFYLNTPNIYLDNFNFKVENMNRDEPLSFSARKTIGNIQDFIIDGPAISAEIRGLFFSDNRGLEITNLSTDFTYTRTEMDFKNMLLKTIDSELSAHINFSYKEGDLDDFNNKVSIKADFEKSAIAMVDLKKLYTELSGDDLLLFSTKFRGTLNDFSLNNFNSNSRKGMEINGDLEFQNAINTENGFVFHGNFKNVTANHQQLKSILPNLLGNSLPTEFKRLGNFSLAGFTEITSDEISASIRIKSEIGTVISDLHLTNVSHIDAATYNGEIEFVDFNLGKFFNDPLLGDISFKGEVNGRGFKLENIKTSIIGSFSKLVFKNYEYHNVNVNGQYQNNLFDGDLLVNDEFLKMDFHGLADLSSATHEFDFRANIEFADLRQINIFTRDTISFLTGKVKLDVVGNTFDDIVGTATFGEVFYTNQLHEYEFDEFVITSAVKDSIKTISIDSKDIIRGELEGNFTFSNVLPMAQNALGSMYTNYVPYKVAQNQFLNFNFTIYNQIVEVFYPHVSIDKNTKILGRIDAEDNQLKLTISSPKIVIFENEIKNLLLRTDNQNTLYNSHLTASEINTKYYNVTKFNLLNRTQNDTLFFKSVFKGDSLSNEDFNVDFYYTIDKKQKSVVGIQKSSLNFKDYTWLINPDEDRNNKIVFDLKTNKFNFSPFVLVSNEQKIEFTGIINGEDKTLFTDFTKVKLESFLPTIDSLNLKGVLDGSIDFVQKDGLYSPQGILLINDFKINNFEQGDLSLSVKGENSYEKYSVDLSLQKKNVKSLNAKGTLDFSTENPLIDLKVYVEDFKLNSLSPLGKDVLSKLRGKASGNFTVKGLLGNPAMDGFLKLAGAGVKFPYLNVDYDFKGEAMINLEGQSFYLDGIRLEDTKYKSEGELNGSITHQNFKSWFMDVIISANDLLVLDTVDSEESLYYGTAFISGEASISGLTDQLTIDVNGKTAKGTVFVIPLKDVQSISNYRLIHFKNPNFDIQKGQNLARDAVKGVSLNIDLEVNTEATAEVVIDEVNGSKLKGTGTGNLAINIDTRGKFEMYGDYTIEKGVYDFKYGGIINKPFEIQRGSVVSWSGDPTDANLNVTAIYQVKANPAIILENFNTNRKIPVSLIIRISGGLFTSKQDFDIKIPNVNSNIASELEFVLNENDANNNAKQFFNLLAFGNFSSPDKAEFNSNAVLVGTTSNLIAGVLTDMITKDGGKFQVGFDYTQGNQNDVESLNTDNQVDFSVSTQITNRVIINGKVGVPVGPKTQSSIVGEVKIEVLLTEEGNLRGVVFNRQNEIQYSVEEEGYTQGIGLSYQVDFNSLADLLRKVGLKKKAKATSENKEQNKIDSLTTSRFINYKSVINN